MSTVIEQVKNAAYASVGVNLLVTDAIVGRELATPEVVAEHALEQHEEAPAPEEGVVEEDAPTGAAW